eukprot:5447377-Alexandrium_andersonii.AAC.1
MPSQLGTQRAPFIHTGPTANNTVRRAECLTRLRMSGGAATHHELLRGVSNLKAEDSGMRPHALHQLHGPDLPARLRCLQGCYGKAQGLSLIHI